jgi:hypothetical protein
VNLAGSLELVAPGAPASATVAEEHLHPSSPTAPPGQPPVLGPMGRPLRAAPPPASAATALYQTQWPLLGEHGESMGKTPLDQRPDKRYAVVASGNIICAHISLGEGRVAGSDGASPMFLTHPAQRFKHSCLLVSSQVWVSYPVNFTVPNVFIWDTSQIWVSYPVNLTVPNVFLWDIQCLTRRCSMCLRFFSEAGTSALLKRTSRALLIARRMETGWMHEASMMLGRVEAIFGSMWTSSVSLPYSRILFLALVVVSMTVSQTCSILASPFVLISLAVFHTVSPLVWTACESTTTGKITAISQYACVINPAFLSRNAGFETPDAW